MQIRVPKNVRTTAQGDWTQSQIKESIKKESQHVELLFSQVDETKTQIQTDKQDGVKLSVFYDKDGNKLFTKLSGYGAGKMKDAVTYRFESSDGGRLQLNDYNNDGNIDMMYYSDKNDKPIYQAEDKNDDGRFDEAMYNSGPNVAQSFDIKS